MAGPGITLQGNLDPARLLSPIPEIKKEVTRMLNGFGSGRYIANLGHGILPHVPVDHAKAFVDTVKNHVYQTQRKTGVFISIRHAIKSIHTEKQSLIFRESWIQYIHALQDTICSALEKAMVRLHFMKTDGSDQKMEAVVKRG